MTRPVDLSVIIPAYNEASRIEDVLRVLAAHLEQRRESCEILVVDDGSTDDTTDRVQSLANEVRVPLRSLRYEPNRGKGFALKVGFPEAHGEKLVFMDADLSVPIAFLDPLLAALDEGADVAIGSRRMKGARIDRRQPRVRESLGTVFTWLVQTLIADVSDATCGFKAFRRSAGLDLFDATRLHDWSFDAEVLFLARKRAYSVREVPVSWVHREGTKVRPIRDGLRSLLGLARIRLGDLRGTYATRPGHTRPTSGDPAQRPGKEAETCER